MDNERKRSLLDVLDPGKNSDYVIYEDLFKKASYCRESREKLLEHLKDVYIPAPRVVSRDIFKQEESVVYNDFLYQIYIGKVRWTEDGTLKTFIRKVADKRWMRRLKFVINDRKGKEGVEAVKYQPFPDNYEPSYEESSDNALSIKGYVTLIKDEELHLQPLHGLIIRMWLPVFFGYIFTVVQEKIFREQTNLSISFLRTLLQNEIAKNIGSANENRVSPQVIGDTLKRNRGSIDQIIHRFCTNLRKRNDEVQS